MWRGVEYQLFGRNLIANACKFTIFNKTIRAIWELKVNASLMPMFFPKLEAKTIKDEKLIEDIKEFLGH